MAQEQPISASETLAPRTLWLDIRFADERWTFELAPDEDRAIVVGSLLRAHVRIDRSGIAPVHFHFEREGDAVRLIPAYRADLCVNGVAVAGPHPIDQHAVIEFSGIRLQAHVLENEPGVSEELHLRDWTRDELPNCGALLALPDCADPTRVAFRRTSSEPPADAAGLETRAFRPLFDVHLGRHPGVAREGAQRGGELSEDAAESVASPVRAIIPQAIIQLGARAPSPASEPLPAVALPVIREPRHVNVPDEHPSIAPLCTNLPHARDGLPFLARLGIAARRRPVGAALGALVGSLVLALAMLGFSRISSPSRTHLARMPERIVSSSLPSVGSSQAFPSFQGAPEVAGSAEPSSSGEVTTTVPTPDPAPSSVPRATPSSSQRTLAAIRQRQHSRESAPRKRQLVATRAVPRLSSLAAQSRQ